MSMSFLIFDISESNLFLKELIFKWAVIILSGLSLRTKRKLSAYFEEGLHLYSAVEILLLVHL